VEKPVVDEEAAVEKVAERRERRERRIEGNFMGQSKLAPCYPREKPVFHSAVTSRLPSSLFYLAAKIYFRTAASSASEIPAFQAMPGVTMCQSAAETSEGIIGSWQRLHCAM